MLLTVNSFFSAGLPLVFKVFLKRATSKFLVCKNSSVYLYNLNYIYGQLKAIYQFIRGSLIYGGQILFISFGKRFDLYLQGLAKSCFQGALLSNFYTPGLFSNHREYKRSIKHYYKKPLKLPSLVFFIQANSWKKCAQTSFSLVKELIFLGTPVFGFFSNSSLKFFLPNSVQSYDATLVYFFCSFVFKTVRKFYA